MGSMLSSMRPYVVSMLATMVASMPRWLLGAGNVPSTTKEQTLYFTLRKI